MNRFIPLSAIVIALLALANIPIEAIEDFPEAGTTNPEAYDVVVVGGTPAGVAAAIAAGRAGKTVILIEQSPVLGGMNASGVIRLDDLYVESNSGVMEEFRQRVKTYHRTKLAEDPLVKAHLTRDPRFPWNVADGRAWEPHTAARIYAEMVAELDTITTRFNEVPVDVEMNENRVTGVITQDRDNQGNLGKKQAYTGKVIIDATYEADLAEFAKIPYRIGREARSAEEPHAGQIYTNFFRGVPGALKATILPHSTGEADDRSQAFTYRLTGKDYGRPDHAFRVNEAPPNYDPAKYQWNRNSKPIIPNGKFDLLGINWGGDLTGYGTRWVLADWEERAEIEKIFRNYDLGWLYYIQTEGGSPNIGLPEDEFADNNNLPYRLYVRQGRRIEGRYTLTESDLHKDLRGNGLRGPLHPDSVAIGIYGIDAHNVQAPTSRKEPRSGEGAAEGTLHLFDVTGPYQIPYDVMVPKQHRGILFPVGISSTHVAMCSVRMEPVWSALGQAAGVAAALAVERGVALAEVPVTQIQDELVGQGVVLFFYTDLPKTAPAFEAVQKLSLLGAFENTDPDRFQTDGPAASLSDLNKKVYRFRPNDPVTLGEFARMVVRGLQIPLSITAAHFNDVPRNYPAFKYIETLYDHSTQSQEPFLDYDILREPEKRARVLARPDQELSGEYATKILTGLLRKEVPSSPDLNANLTRGEAAQLIYQQIKSGTE
ncbi:MAG: FAD-dependent oxidoreductase [Verrucomicrobiaceae bacterium]|nr:FAD-dependent oxidoreductase [Verrucomicrobiaceae bacterium]